MWSEQADSHHNDNGGGDDGDGEDDEEEDDEEEQLQLCIWKELPWMPVAKQPPANRTWLVTSLLAMRLAGCMSKPGNSKTKTPCKKALYQKHQL